MFFWLLTIKIIINIFTSFDSLSLNYFLLGGSGEFNRFWELKALAKELLSVVWIWICINSSKSLCFWFHFHYFLPFISLLLFAELFFHYYLKSWIIIALLKVLVCCILGSFLSPSKSGEIALCNNTSTFPLRLLSNLASWFCKRLSKLVSPVISTLKELVKIVN